MKREFDITGFVHFPGELHPTIKRLNTGKTFVYLTAFDTDFSFSKVNLRTKGHFSGDDLTPEHHVDTSLMTIDDLVKLMKSESNININTQLPLLSCVLLGWSKFSYSYKDDIQPWLCGFRNLTEDGKKMYYSFKKLHNTKEIRLLTFEGI
mgnify:CR=1 FL=1